MEFKVIATALANMLGFGVVFIGIVQTTEGWKQNILFALGVIFLTVKVGTGIIQLLKKNLSTMKNLSTSSTELRK
jgi:hypothetical protein